MQNIRLHIQFARRMARLLDRYALDPLISIVPGFGNVVGVLLSCYLFWIAYMLRVPQTIYVQMIKNIGIDFLLGSVPVAGIVFDLLFKANIKNLSLLEPYIEENVINGEIVS